MGRKHFNQKQKLEILKSAKKVGLKEAADMAQIHYTTVYQWQKMFDAGLFARVAGWLGNRVVISPPCTITIEEADKTLDILKTLIVELKSK